MASQWNEQWVPSSWAASSWWQTPQTSHTAPTWTMPHHRRQHQKQQTFRQLRGRQRLHRAAIPQSIQRILAQLVCQFPRPSSKMGSTTTPTWSSNPPSGRPWSHPHGVEPKDLQAWIFVTLQLPISADVAWKNMELRPLSHGRFTGLILTRNVAETVLLSQIQKRLREDNIDVDATIEAIYKSKDLKPPDKVKEATNFVTPLVDEIFLAMKPWTQVKNYGKNSEQDNQVAQRMQELEEEALQRHQAKWTKASDEHDLHQNLGHQPQEDHASSKHKELDQHIQQVHNLLEEGQYTKVQLQELVKKALGLAPIRRRVQGQKRHLVNALPKQAQFWKILYATSSDTKQEYDASRELRSGKHDNKTVTLLYRLANHMEQPWRSKDTSPQAWKRLTFAKASPTSEQPSPTSAPATPCFRPKDGYTIKFLINYEGGLSITYFPTTTASLRASRHSLRNSGNSIKNSSDMSLDSITDSSST
ncbi:unnamed protein product [Symbiodinium necroappetens]|uniref:Uncharacterized protein n=1 Tax=Symbiodinium necroappetens TaxID=1628268 RepID=A0A813AFL9_9DINO|nr:unnamed protein product [Symbiodinium necroappetens]